MDGEAAERHGMIGSFRADFINKGRELYSAWENSQPHLKTSTFKKEFDEVINSLRYDGESPPFGSRINLVDFCRNNYKNNLTTHGRYIVRTQDYSYCFHLLRQPGDYDIHCFVYANRLLLPELAGLYDTPKGCYTQNGKPRPIHPKKNEPER